MYPLAHARPHAQNCALPRPTGREPAFAADIACGRTNARARANPPAGEVDTPFRLDHLSTGMSTVRVVWGAGSGPTGMAAYDTALAAAGIEDYNLVTVSSVVPADATLEVVGEAPDLGAVGNRLTVVQSRADRAPGAGAPAVAGLGWARSASGRGLFYEATGADPDAVRTEIREGLAAGKALRDWTFEDEDVVVREAAPDPDAHVTQVVCATYGQSRPIL